MNEQENDVFNKLKALEDAGEFETLLQKTEEYLKDNPDIAMLYLFKGDALRELGNLTEALNAYRFSIVYDPDDPLLRTKYAQALFDLHDYVGALNAADSAALMQPDFADPYLISGNVLSHLGHFEQSMYPYHKAFTFMPENIILGLYVAELYAKTEEYESCFTLLMQILSKHPSNRYIQLQMAASLCFFMQNGLELKMLDSYLTQWASAYPKDNFVQRVKFALLSRDLSFNPLSVENVAKAFNDFSSVHDESEEEDISIIGDFLNDKLKLYYHGRNNITVLDAGCGTGALMDAMIPYVSEGQLIGVDVASNMLDMAIDRKIYDSFSLQEMASFASSKPKTFDLVCAFNCLDYNLDLRGVLSAFYDTLQKDGLMFFTVRHNEVTSDDQILYPPFNWIFSAEHIKSILKSIGFTLLSMDLMYDENINKAKDKKYIYVVKK